VVEFRVDRIGVGHAGADAGLDYAELVEDVQGLLPGVARGVAVAGGEVRVSEVIQGRGESVAVAQLLLDGDGLLEVSDGLVVLAEEVVGVAEAVHGVCFEPAISDLPIEGESLLGFAE
jgi:hypothetical protein